MDGYKRCELLNATKRCHSTDGVNRKNTSVPVDVTHRDWRGVGRWGPNVIDKGLCNCYFAIGFDFTI